MTIWKYLKQIGIEKDSMILRQWSEAKGTVWVFDPFDRIFPDDFRCLLTAHFGDCASRFARILRMGPAEWAHAVVVPGQTCTALKLLLWIHIAWSLCCNRIWIKYTTIAIIAWWRLSWCDQMSYSVPGGGKKTLWSYFEPPWSNCNRIYIVALWCFSGLLEATFWTKLKIYEWPISKWTAKDFLELIFPGLLVVLFFIPFRSSSWQLFEAKDAPLCSEDSSKASGAHGVLLFTACLGRGRKGAKACWVWKFGILQELAI